jgi:hypothetical protein
MVEILAQPSSTGDLGTLTISRDKDLDGTFDEALSVPKPVSGSAPMASLPVTQAPGTIATIIAGRWAVRNDLKLAEVDLSSLAACYCINASCGSNLAWTNLATVLKDIGGGVVGALTTADPRIAVAQVAVDGPVIRYTGAQTTACSSAPPCRSHPMPAMLPASRAMRQRLHRQAQSSRRSLDRRRASAKARNCATARSPAISTCKALRQAMSSSAVPAALRPMIMVTAR